MATLNNTLPSVVTFKWYTVPILAVSLIFRLSAVHKVQFTCCQENITEEYKAVIYWQQHLNAYMIWPRHECTKKILYGVCLDSGADYTLETVIVNDGVLTHLYVLFTPVHIQCMLNFYLKHQRFTPFPCLLLSWQIQSFQAEYIAMVMI